MISVTRIAPVFACIAVGDEVVMNVHTGAGWMYTLAQLARLPRALLAWAARRALGVVR